MQALTIDQFKATLPDMPVSFQGKTYTGRVRGRKLPFPVVSIQVGGTWIDFEYTWKGLTASYNRGATLTA